MMFTAEVYKTDKRTKQGERLVGKYDYDRKEGFSLKSELEPVYPSKLGYRIEIFETYVTKTNLMGGGQFEERYDTPHYCSPSSESYWSM